MRPYDVFKMRHFICTQGHTFSEVAWGLADTVPCRECGAYVIEGCSASESASAAIHGDEIDIVVRHGACNPDGSPRRFTSKSELRRAAAENGFTIYGETPNVSGRLQEERAREREERRR